jgi:hypothetical protein
MQQLQTKQFSNNVLIFAAFKPYSWVALGNDIGGILITVSKLTFIYYDNFNETKTVTSFIIEAI